MFSNLNDVQKNIVWQIIIYVSIFIICVIGLIVTGIHRNEDFNNLATAHNMQNVATIRKNKHESAVQKSVLLHSATSNDPIMRSVGQNNVNTTLPASATSTFFKNYYNNNSSNDFNHRSQRTFRVITPTLANNKSIFSSDKGSFDALGLHQVLSNVSLTVMSRNGNNDNLLLESYYTAWHNSDDGVESQKHNGEQWYTATYNTNIHKFTNIQKLYSNTHADSQDQQVTTNQTGDGVIY